MSTAQRRLTLRFRSLLGEHRRRRGRSARASPGFIGEHFPSQQTGPAGPYVTISVGGPLDGIMTLTRRTLAESWSTPPGEAAPHDTTSRSGGRVSTRPDPRGFLAQSTHGRPRGYTRRRPPASLGIRATATLEVSVSASAGTHRRPAVCGGVEPRALLAGRVLSGARAPVRRRDPLAVVALDVRVEDGPVSRIGRVERQRARRAWAHRNERSVRSAYQPVWARTVGRHGPRSEGRSDHASED